ncbi:hypothetical protein IU476_35800, partial [Nocardia blacklockiae]|nr:hypothetical protein [Nocardia blacklockiae]
SATVAAIAGGRTTIPDTVGDGRLQAEGDPEALRTLLTLMETRLNGYRGPVENAGG